MFLDRITDRAYKAQNSTHRGKSASSALVKTGVDWPRLVSCLRTCCQQFTYTQKLIVCLTGMRLPWRDGDHPMSLQKPLSQALLGYSPRGQERL